MTYGRQKHFIECNNGTQKTHHREEMKPLLGKLPPKQESTSVHIRRRKKNGKRNKTPDQEHNCYHRKFAGNYINLRVSLVKPWPFFTLVQLP
jgi:hypothetical protein